MRKSDLLVLRDEETYRLDGTKHRRDDLIRARDDALENIESLESQAESAARQAESAEDLAVRARDAVRRIDALWSIRDEFLVVSGSPPPDEVSGTVAEFRKSRQDEVEKRDEKLKLAQKHQARAELLRSSIRDGEYSIEFLRGFVRHLDEQLGSAPDPSDSPRTEGAPAKRISIKDVSELVEHLDDSWGEDWDLVILGRHRATGDVAAFVAQETMDRRQLDPEVVGAAMAVINAYAGSGDDAAQGD